MQNIQAPTFGELFKKYRLKSEIESIAEFRDLITEEDIYYETSLYTKWQNNSRLPQDRNVVLAIVKLFIKLGGITSLQEADLFFATLKLHSLTDAEETFLSALFYPVDIVRLPAQPRVFFYASPLSNEFDIYTSQIYDHIQKIGYQHLCHEAKKHTLRHHIQEIDAYEEEFYIESQNTVRALRKADICIFDTSFRSLAAGYFIHEAFMLYKPTVILYYKDNRPYVFLGALKNQAIVKSYDKQNLTKILERVMDMAYRRTLDFI